MGGKNSYMMHAFNITVNHRRCIISTTRGYLGRWNDKTLVKFDKFASGVQDGTILDDMTFELFEISSDGTIMRLCIMVVGS